LIDKSVQQVSVARSNGDFFSSLYECSIVPGILVVILLALACSENPIKSSSPSTLVYVIESEPTRSLDGQYVYLISEDTANSDNSGIYRAKVGKPIRERVFTGVGLHSPTIASNNSTLAFLHNKSIKYYDLSTGDSSSSLVTGSFTSIQFLNDTLMVAQIASTVYLVNESRNTKTLVADGWGPSVAVRDTFIYVVQIPGYAYGIAKCDVSRTVCDTIFYISVLENSGIVRGPSWNPLSNRLAWVHDNTRSMQVHVGAAEPYTDREIDITTHEKALMINSDLVIFTGPDGRLYQSNFSGAEIWPWWHAEN
jgi:hypothetical protein